MKCLDCKTQMEYVSCFDEGAGGHFAFNLYQCKECGTVAKHDVWENKGVIWIDNTGKIVRAGEPVE